MLSDAASFVYSDLCKNSRIGGKELAKGTGKSPFSEKKSEYLWFQSNVLDFSKCPMTGQYDKRKSGRQGVQFWVSNKCQYMLQWSRGFSNRDITSVILVSFYQTMRNYYPGLSTALLIVFEIILKLNWKHVYLLLKACFHQQNCMLFLLLVSAPT